MPSSRVSFQSCSYCCGTVCWLLGKALYGTVDHSEFQPCDTEHTSLQAGEVEVILQSIAAGGRASPDVPLVSTMLQSPSAQCNQLLRIADLQSVAIREQSFVPDGASTSARAPSSVFLVGKLGYRPGEIQQPTAEGPPAPMPAKDTDIEMQKRAMLCPPGLSVQVGSPVVP